jgi:hypothetical protein
MWWEATRLSNLRRKQTFTTELKLPPDIPEKYKALGSDLTDKHTTVASYGGVGSQTGGMHHGHGGKSPEEDIDTEKFFRFVAKRLMITIPVRPAYHLYWLPCQSTRIFHKVSDILSLLPVALM